MRISDWSSDVCSSDLASRDPVARRHGASLSKGKAMRSLNIGATGMLAQQLNVEVISNNIANMNTTGFKRHRAEFQDLLYQNLRRVGSASSDAGTIVPTGVQLGLGVKSAAIYRISGQEIGDAH